MGIALIFDGIIVTDPLQTITILEPDSDAERIAGYFTDVDSEQFSALNTFIKALKSAGIFSKLSYLMIPKLASNVSEALQNVLSAQKNQPRSPTGWEMDSDNCLKPIPATVTNIVLTPYMVNTEGISSKNFSTGVSFVLGEKDPDVVSEIIMGVNMPGSLTQSVGIKIYRDEGGAEYNDGTQAVSSGSKNQFSLSVDADGVLSDEVARKSFYLKDSQNTLNSITTKNFKADTEASISTTPSLKLGYGNSTGAYHRTFWGSYRLLWVSEVLEKQELLDMHLAVRAFIDALEGLSE